MPTLLLAAAFSLNALGNIFLKIGAMRGITLTASPAALIGSNWQFILGMVFFGLNAICYFLALRSFPISIAYPIMVVMSFVIINAYALTALGEQLNALQIGGYALVVIGLALIVAPLA